MKNITLVLGGGRSGKSSYSEKIAKIISNDKKNRYYIATAEAFDSEMVNRIKKHQENRGDDFITIEEPIKLSETLEDLQSKASVILIDCLTVWLGNLMYHKKEKELKKLLNTLISIECPLIMVSNETGMEVVPDNEECKQFINLSQNMNRQISLLSDNVILCISSIPLALKGELM